MSASPHALRAVSSFALLASVGFFACGDSEPPQSTAPFATLGELHDAIEAARASPDEAIRRDTDGDRIPDSVERRLGTTVDDRDSDRDGLTDNIELFGTGTFDREAALPDGDADGAIAPIDRDDDNDGVNDGERIDSDGDGIANYLEFYGYTYDWLTEAFVAWDGDPAITYYRTDPLQLSTDQDAYSDATEVTGIGLDVTLQAPGAHPLVPAIPNIVVELVGYSVTLNQEITYEEGRSLAVGQTWERTTEQASSFTDERSWEAGIEAGYASSSAQVLVHANYGESYASTQSTSTAVATGTSVLDDQQWSVARTSNPIDAARIKLYVKVHNRGTAPLSNIVPTLTLRIGGLGVATFQPGNAQTNMLVPGDSYPREPLVTWVIDSINTGGGSAPLSLTMRELRALENGAPVGLTATQLAGDVMRLDETSTWQTVGDANEYLARADAVSANIRFDLGNGTFVHHLVYADDSPSGVPVTVRDALRLLGVGDDGVLRFTDRGAARSLPLTGYDFVFDTETLRRNGWRFEDGVPAAPPENFALDTMRLFAGSNLFVRAPRELAGEAGPVIHFAYIDTEAGEVKVCTSDYEGIATVTLHNGDADDSLVLVEDIPGAGYFSAETAALTFEAGEEYLVVVTNRRGQTAQRSLGRLFTDPGPRVPIIRSVSLDLASHSIYANVESGAVSDPDSVVDWVRVYHPGLPGTYVALDHVPNAFEDANGYTAELPFAFASSNVEVVAFVTTNVYRKHRVTESEVVTARVAGTVQLPGHVDTTGAEEEWLIPRFDFDNGIYNATFYAADDWSDSFMPGPPADIFVIVDESNTGWVYFNGTYRIVPAGYTYETLSRDEIEGLVPSSTARLKLNDATGLQTGDLLAIVTSDGRYAKARVVSIGVYDSSWTNVHDRTLALDYVTFENP